MPEAHHLDSLKIFWEPKDLNSPHFSGSPIHSTYMFSVGSGQLHSTLSTILSGHILIMTSPIYCIHYCHYGCTFIGGLSLNLHHVLSRLTCFPWSFKFRVNFNRGSTFTSDFSWSLFWETLTLTHSAKHQLVSMTPLCLLNHYVRETHIHCHICLPTWDVAFSLVAHNVCILPLRS